MFERDLQGLYRISIFKINQYFVLTSSFCNNKEGTYQVEVYINLLKFSFMKIFFFLSDICGCWN